MIWRQGTSKRRHIYVQTGPEPHHDDPEVAVAVGSEQEAQQIARQIVDAMNAQQHSGNQAAIARAYEQAGRIDATVEESERVSQRAAEVRRQGRQRGADRAYCSVGVGGGEVCFRPAGHDGPHDPDWPHPE